MLGEDGFDELDDFLLLAAAKPGAGSRIRMILLMPRILTPGWLSLRPITGWGL
jgi:hypothetical protein